MRIGLYTAVACSVMLAQHASAVSLDKTTVLDKITGNDAAAKATKAASATTKTAAKAGAVAAKAAAKTGAATAVKAAKEGGAKAKETTTTVKQA